MTSSTSSPTPIVAVDPGNCCICLEGLDMKTTAILQCKHGYHARCLDEMASRTCSLCALCKGEFGEKTVQLPGDMVGVCPVRVQSLTDNLSGDLNGIRAAPAPAQPGAAAQPDAAAQAGADLREITEGVSRLGHVFRVFRVMTIQQRIMELETERKEKEETSARRLAACARQMRATTLQLRQYEPPMDRSTQEYNRMLRSARSRRLSANQRRMTLRAATAAEQRCTEEIHLEVNKRAKARMKIAIFGPLVARDAANFAATAAQVDAIHALDDQIDALEDQRAERRREFQEAARRRRGQRREGEEEPALIDNAGELTDVEGQ